MGACEKLLGEHLDDGDATCAVDTGHAAAIARRRAARTGRWPGVLEARREPGGWRHFLDGEPVHCAAGLELQAVEEGHDDYGEWSEPQPRGVGVRYEGSLGGERQTATLNTDVGGHEFVAALEPWMRFRWPGRGR